MCWTPPYTRHKTKTSKIQKHSTLCVGHHHTQDTRRRHTKQKHSTLCVGHHRTQDTRRRQAKYKNQAQYVLDTTIHKTQDKVFTFRVHPFIPLFIGGGSCCTIFCLLCSDLSTIVCLSFFSICH